MEVEVRWKDVHYRATGETKDDVIYESWPGQAAFHRSWCIQELFLASRCLLMADRQLYWKCKQNSQAEVLQNSQPLRCVFSKDSLNYEYELSRSWQQLTRDYSRTNVTFAKDRVVAMAGLAAWFVDRYTSLGIRPEYCAGLWRHNLLSGFLWRAKPSDIRASACDASERRGLANICLPSWSWLWTDGITYMVEAATSLFPLAEVVNTTINSEIPSILYGNVVEATITIRAPIIRLVANKTVCTEEQTDPFLRLDSDLDIYLGVSRSDPSLNFGGEQPRSIDVEIYDDERSAIDGAGQLDVLALMIGHITFDRYARTKIFALLVKPVPERDQGALHAFKRCGLVEMRYNHYHYGELDETTRKLSSRLQEEVSDFRKLLDPSIAQQQEFLLV